MITSDPPEHTRLRGMARGASLPPSMDSLRPRVAEIVEARLDRLAAWGLHFCLGARLARMEGQLVFQALRRRFSKVEPTGPWERRPGLAFRALDSLPVRVTHR